MVVIKKYVFALRVLLCNMNSLKQYTVFFPVSALRFSLISDIFYLDFFLPLSELSGCFLYPRSKISLEKASRDRLHLFTA